MEKIIAGPASQGALDIDAPWWTISGQLRGVWSAT